MYIVVTHKFIGEKSMGNLNCFRLNWDIKGVEHQHHHHRKWFCSTFFSDLLFYDYFCHSYLLLPQCIVAAYLVSQHEEVIKWPQNHIKMLINLFFAKPIPLAQREPKMFHAFYGQTEEELLAVPVEMFPKRNLIHRVNGVRDIGWS